MPLSFSDSQMDAIRNAARPLDAFIRSAFISAIGQYFYGKSEVGDGELGRCLRELQYEFMHYPPRRSPGGARGRHDGFTRA